MKKLIMIIGVAMISLTSCNKEVNANKDKEPVENCNCGTITDNNATEARYNPYIHAYYAVKNDCSGNVELFYPSLKEGSESNDIEAYMIGDTYTVPNGQVWCHKDINYSW